jgi:hypothetical protein
MVFFEHQFLQHVTRSRADLLSAVNNLPEKTVWSSRKVNPSCTKATLTGTAPFNHWPPWNHQSKKNRLVTWCHLSDITLFPSVPAIPRSPNHGLRRVPASVPIKPKLPLSSSQLRLQRSGKSHRESGICWTLATQQDVTSMIPTLDPMPDGMWMPTSNVACWKMPHL